jgi:hypothetical protein
MKLPKVNDHPMDENSPNLVTLMWSRSAMGPPAPKNGTNDNKEESEMNYSGADFAYFVHVRNVDCQNVHIRYENFKMSKSDMYVECMYIKCHKVQVR